MVQPCRILSIPLSLGRSVCGLGRKADRLLDRIGRPSGPTGREIGAQGFGRRPMPWVIRRHSQAA